MYREGGYTRYSSPNNILHLLTLFVGFVHHIDAMVCALVVHGLGAGRQKPGEKVNLAVGVELAVQVGSNVAKG